MGIWDSIRISLICNFLLFGSIMLGMLVVQPIYTRIKYSVLFKKFKKLDERLKSDPKKMDPGDWVKGLKLREHLDIERYEDLLLVRPPTIKNLMMEGWRQILISKKGLLAIFLASTILTTWACFKI